MQWLISQQDLLADQEVALRSDRLAYVTGDQVTLTVLAKDRSPDEVPSCIIEGGELELPRRASPTLVSDQAGVYRVNFGALPPGHYQAKLEGVAEDQAGRSANLMCVIRGLKSSKLTRDRVCYVKLPNGAEADTWIRAKRI